MQTKRPDRLSALIRQFRIKATVYPPGGAGDRRPPDDCPAPNLFIARRGELDFLDGRYEAQTVAGPKLAFFPCGAPPDMRIQLATEDAGYLRATVDMGGVAARYVKLTANSNWGVMTQYGLSEVRFMYIPAQAREPEPADGATDVSVATSLTWRAGRDAVSHEVYFGTDPEALALADTVSGNSYTPGALDLATTYYWQVTAVQDAESWTGGLWDFTTQDYLVVEDFESYDDEDNRIYNTWLDGWVNETGSTVGHLESPFAEHTIVNSGRQSMPLFYDNTGGATSEADFDPAQDWTANGVFWGSASHSAKRKSTGAGFAPVM